MSGRCFICDEPIADGRRFEFVSLATFRVTCRSSDRKQVCKVCMVLGMTALDTKEDERAQKGTG